VAVSGLNIIGMKQFWGIMSISVKSWGDVCDED